MFKKRIFTFIFIIISGLIFSQKEKEITPPYYIKSVYF
jgi:hypothetical protein